KKLFFSPDGERLLGGILVGDASEYGQLVATYKGGKPLTCDPSALLVGDKKAGGAGLAALDDSAQICSCNNVSKGQICEAVREGKCTLAELKSCTKAGTGCGGCVPLVTDLLKMQLTKLGLTVNNSLCEHFAYTRQELFEIVKIKGIRDFDTLVAEHGKGLGCEICKPAVASILASLWSDNIQIHQTLQDTNDRF